MYDLKRFRGILSAAVAIALALSGCSLLARALAGGRPGWLAGGDSTMEGGQDTIVGGRISGVLAEEKRHGARIKDLGVLLGASAIGTDIDPLQLVIETGPPLPKRWLNLNANGANLADLRGLSDLLLRSGLKPKLIILGIHPGLLARSDNYLTDPTTFDAARLRREFAARHVRGVQAEVESLAAIPLNLAFPNRSRINSAFRGLVADAKQRAFASIGLGASALYAPAPNPWSVRQLLPNQPEPKDAPAEGRKATARDQAIGPMLEGLGRIRDKGWSDASSYSLDGANARALVAMIRDARARGVEVQILILPERSDMRRSVAPEARRCLQDVLDRNFGAQAPPIIDMGSAMADEAFFDQLHLLRDGQIDATRKLGKAIRSKPGVP